MKYNNEYDKGWLHAVIIYSAILYISSFLIEIKPFMFVTTPIVYILIKYLIEGIIERRKKW